MSFDLSIFNDAAPFIRITDEKRLNLVSDQIEKFKPPSGAKVVWCPTPEDPAMQYTRASWSETKNGMAQLVRFDNKQVRCLIDTGRLDQNLEFRFLMFYERRVSLY